MHVIDGHSHIGNDTFWKNVGDIQEYLKNLEKKGISEAFIMSVACPTIERNDQKVSLLIHGEKNIENDHLRIIKNKDGSITKELIKKNDNPYKEANDLIYNIVTNNSSPIKLNYVPLIHPYYYSYEDFISNLKRGAKMFKIHGIAGGVLPDNISDEFFEMIESLGVSLIIHTDYSKTNDLQMSNSPDAWLNRLSKYNIDVYLAHAARLSENAISTINQDSRYMVGIGPDLLLSRPGRNYIDTDHYLETCLEKFNINKMIFDIDYPWNIISNQDYSLDWDSIDRINSLLSKNEQEIVYNKNIEKITKGKEVRK